MNFDLSLLLSYNELIKAKIPKPIRKIIFSFIDPIYFTNLIKSPNFEDLAIVIINSKRVENLFSAFCLQSNKVYKKILDFIYVDIDKYFFYLDFLVKYDLYNKMSLINGDLDDKEVLHFRRNLEAFAVFRIYPEITFKFLKDYYNIENCNVNVFFEFVPQLLYIREKKNLKFYVDCLKQLK